MFGLEKQPKEPFEFDLQRDLKKDPDKAHSLIKTIEKTVLDIKASLKRGADSKDFDNLGVLLHGFAALQKVLNRTMTKKK